MKFSRYPSYKDSGVEWLGEVPAHWDLKPLKRCCDVFPSNVDKKSVEGQRAVLLCNYTDVYYNETISAHISFMPATATDDQIEKFTLLSGDILFTKDSETPQDIAVAAYVPNSMRGVICGYHLSIARPRKNVSGKFIKRVFDSLASKAYFCVSANGLTRVGLSQQASDNLPVALAPIDEQTQICRFLDHETAKIDALIAEQQRLIELLQEKRQAVISHAVTKGLNPDAPMKDSGVEWLGEVPAHWDVVRLKYLVKEMTQGWSPQCDEYPVMSASEWGVLKVGCVNGGKFNAAENKRLPDDLTPNPSLSLKKDDLLISRANTRELVGSAALVEKDFPKLLLCDKLYRLRLNDRRVLPSLLANYLSSSAVRKQIELNATGASSSMLNISQFTVAELSVPVPPVNEQVKLCKFIRKNLSDLDSLKVTADSVQKFLRERRSALISAAVTGKIDMRDWQPPEGDSVELSVDTEAA